MPSGVVTKSGLVTLTIRGGGRSSQHHHHTAYALLEANKEPKITINIKKG